MKLLLLLRCGVLLGLLAQSLGAQAAAELDTAARAKHRQRDFEGAIADWTKAIALEPANSALYAGRGGAQRSKGDFAAAVADFDRVIALKPTDAGAYGTRGRLKLNTGDYAGAIADQDKVIALQPDAMMAYYNRATAKQAKGDFEGALVDYDLAIPLAKDTDIHAYYSRYYRLFTARRLQRDVKITELTDKLEKWDGGWNKTIGLYLVNALPEKDFLAQADEGDAKTVRDRHHDVYYYIGMTRLLAGDTAGARDFLGKCVTLNVTYLIELPLAQAELSRLKGRP